MTLLAVAALWLILAVCFCVVSRREPRARRPRLCLGDRTGTRVLPKPASAEQRELASRCGRRFTPLEVDEWARFADLRAVEALRTGRPLPATVERS